MIDRESKPCVREGLVLRQLEDDWVVYDPAGKLLHMLNLPALAVWNLCDGEVSVAGMVLELRDMFQEAPGVAEIEIQVAALVEEFRAAGLLT